MRYQYIVYVNHSLGGAMGTEENRNLDKLLEHFENNGSVQIEENPCFSESMVVNIFFRYLVKVYGRQGTSIGIYDGPGNYVRSIE